MYTTSKIHKVATKTGTGIFADENIKMAKELEYHMGRFVKVRIKANGIKLERQVGLPLIRSVQLGQVEVLTVL